MPTYHPSDSSAAPTSEPLTISTTKEALVTSTETEVPLTTLIIEDDDESLGIIQTKESKSIPIWLWVIIAVGALMVSLGVFFAIKKFRKDDESEEKNEKEGEGSIELGKDENTPLRTTEGTPLRSSENMPLHTAETWE